MKSALATVLVLLSTVACYLVLVACDPPPEISGPPPGVVDKTITYFLNPVVMTEGFDTDPSTLDDHAIAYAAADVITFCELEENLLESIPENLNVTGHWFDELNPVTIDLKRALQVSYPRDYIDLSAYGYLLAYIFRLDGGAFYSIISGDLDNQALYPNWSLLRNDSDENIVAAIGAYVDWHDRIFYALIGDMELIYDQGSGSSDYADLPGKLKSGKVVGQAGSNAATQNVKIWILRNKPGGGINDTTEKQYYVPGYTLAIPNYEGSGGYPGFSFHNHIFINQRALRESEADLYDYCNFVGDDPYGLERAVGLFQATLLHELGHVMTSELSSHCGNSQPEVSGRDPSNYGDGTCLMSEYLDGSKRDWVCSTDWSTLQFYYNWVVEK